MIRLPISLAVLRFTVSAFPAEPFDDKFRQLDELLPTPGAIRATLDEPNRAISAAETVTYHNNSPVTLWLQLDQNLFTPGSDNRASATQPSREA